MMRIQKPMIEQIMATLHVANHDTMAATEEENDSFSELGAFDILDVYLRPSTRWEPPGPQGDGSWYMV